MKTVPSCTMTFYMLLGHSWSIVDISPDPGHKLDYKNAWIIYVLIWSETDQLSINQRCGQEEPCVRLLWAGCNEGHSSENPRGFPFVSNKLDGSGPTEPVCQALTWVQTTGRGVTWDCRGAAWGRWEEEGAWTGRVQRWCGATGRMQVSSTWTGNLSDRQGLQKKRYFFSRSIWRYAIFLTWFRHYR